MSREKSGRQRVFVYGTLLSGEAAHRLLAEATLLGEARTEPSFELVDLGRYPAIVAGGATAVAGELYEVDAATLAALDHYEDHPRLFRRREIRLAGGGEAWAYLLSGDRARSRPRIPGGDWRRART